MTTERRNRWIVMVVWSALVAFAGFLAAETYRGVDRDLADYAVRINALEVQAAAQREQQRQFELTLAEFKATQKEFRQTVDRLQERKR